MIVTNKCPLRPLLIVCWLVVPAICCKTRVSFSPTPGCPTNAPSKLQGPASPVRCSLLCAQRSWCAAAAVAADGAACELSSADSVWLGWNSSCARTAGVSQARLDAFRDAFLAARNFTQKRIFIPKNADKVLGSWLMQSKATSLVSCVDDCTRLTTCRGVVCYSENCLPLTDFPLCRWFQQPQIASQLTLYEFYSNFSNCFETVTLRVSDALSFNRQWSDFQRGFGAYHDNYFSGMEWLYNRTSSLSVSQLRIDLLFWNDAYIYARYSNFRILAESTNYTIVIQPASDSTASPSCFATNGTPFMTTDVGWTYCGDTWGTHCAQTYLPHWHACCHCAGPFGRYINYPEALNIANRATGISWPPDAPKNITDGFYYSFKQLEMLLLV